MLMEYPHFFLLPLQTQTESGGHCFWLEPVGQGEGRLHGCQDLLYIALHVSCDHEYCVDGGPFPYHA